MTNFWTVSGAAALLLVASPAFAQSAEPAADSEKEKPVEPDAEASILCRPGATRSYPDELEGGIRVSYFMRGQFGELKRNKAYQQLEAAGFRIQDAWSTLTPYGVIWAPKVVVGRRELNRLHDMVCALQRSSNALVLRIRYETRQEAAAGDKAITDARDRLRTPTSNWERYTVEDDKRAGALLPDLDEVGPLVASSWGVLAARFKLQTSLFNRVRDIKCTSLPARQYLCTVGVTALSDRGAEYEQAELRFVREDTGILRLRDGSD